MQTTISYLFTLLLGAVVGVMVGGTSNPMFIGALALMGLLAWLGFAFVHWRWPSRQTIRVTHWKEPAGRSYHIDEFVPWMSPVEQTTEAFIEIDVGRERHIRQIEFDMDSGNNVPLQWRMFAFSKTKAYLPIAGKGLPPHIVGKGIVAARFPNRLPVKVIRIQITEVSKGDNGKIYPWQVRSIRLWEQRCLLRKEIR